MKSGNFKLSFLFIAAGSVLLRYALSFFGQNFDMNSYYTVVSLLENRQGVYSGTPFYNYGPVWFHILYFLNMISGFSRIDALNLRHLLSIFLSISDLYIAYFLLKKSRFTALFFLFSPITLIISGYHCQFDTLAIAVVLIAYSLCCKNNAIQKPLLFSVLLGISLCIKHVFIFLPIWLFFREKHLKTRIMLLCIPWGIFLLSFLPYYNQFQGIVDHVFLYSPRQNALLYKLIPVKPVLIFFPLLIVSGFLFRKKTILDAILFYTALLFIFSSSGANQYLAIPAAFTAYYCNRFTIAYTITAGIFLVLDHSGLHLGPPIFSKLPQCIITASFSFALLTLLLMAGTITAYRKSENSENLSDSL